MDDARAVYPVEIDPLIGALQAKLLAAAGGENDRFGGSVAISGDTAVVGAYYDFSADGSTGSAYVFTLVDGVWTQQTHLYPLDGDSNWKFGHSVALSGDTVLVGAPGDTTKGLDAGAVYVYVRNGGVWTQEAKLLPVGASDIFGSSVALEGDTAVVGEVGAGGARVFHRVAGVWKQQGKLSTLDDTPGSELGHSVALSGNTALVGAYRDGPNDSFYGSAYVFVYSSGMWTQQAKLVAEDPTAGDELGQSVAISGNTAILGAPRSILTAQDKPGAAYVFVRSGTAWSQQAKLLSSDGKANDAFGYSVSVSGNVAVVGAVGNGGSGYVFVRSGSQWPQETKLSASDCQVTNFFGSSVSLSGDMAVVGASGDTAQGTNSGSACVYRLQEPDPNGTPCLTAVQCTSGFCVDGVCCDAACGGAAMDCQACSVATGAAVNGTCGPVSQGTICRPAEGQCDVEETCDGASLDCPADGDAEDGTACKGGTCAGGVCEDGSGSGGGGGDEIDDGGGCGCRTARASSSDARGTACTALGFVGLILMARRRRRRGDNLRAGPGGGRVRGSRPS